MGQEYNSQKVRETLEEALLVLSTCNAEYRLLGSVVTAAILGKQHRDLGDLDVIADTAQRECILKKLYGLGYRHRKGMFAFARKYLSMDSLEHKHLLEIGFFWGKFLEDRSFLIGSEKNGGHIDAHAVDKQKYSLQGISFLGLPERIIARGIASSPNNPKRRKELSLISNRNIKPEKKGYIHIFIFALRADWIYYLAMSLLNILGAIRVKLGLPFDPWR